MGELQYLRPRLYRDTEDSRLITLGRGNNNGVLDLCVKKLILPSDCLRASVRDHPDFQPTEENPLRFYAETSDHSCHGEHWHTHLPLKEDGKHVQESIDITVEMISGRVIDPTIQERVENMNPSLKRFIEKNYFSGTKYATAEEFAFAYSSLIFDPNLTAVIMETPFTTVIINAITGEVEMRKTKTCGYVYGNDKYALDMPRVREQLEQKLLDVKRAYEMLKGRDLSDVPIAQPPKRLATYPQDGQNSQLLGRFEFILQIPTIGITPYARWLPIGRNERNS